MIKGAKYELCPFYFCDCRSIWAFLWVKAANIWPLRDTYTGAQVWLFTVLLCYSIFSFKKICFYLFKTQECPAFLYPPRNPNVDFRLIPICFCYLPIMRQIWHDHAKLSDVVQHNPLSFILNVCTRAGRFCLKFLKTDLFNESVPLLSSQTA